MCKLILVKMICSFLSIAISILSSVISTCWIHVHFLGLFPDRSYAERSAEDVNDDNMYADIELIEDYPMKPVTMFDILKRILAQKPAPPEPTELIKTPFR